MPNRSPRAISPRADVRVYLGKSGSGKTTLALGQLSGRAILFDLAADPELAKGAIVATSPRELVELAELPGELRICWRGDGPGGLLEWGARVALAAGGFALLWDEIDLLTHASGQLGPAAYEVVNRGRHAGLSVYATSRRPARVPRDLMAAATRIVAFRTTDERDLRYLRHFMGAEAAAGLPRLADYEAVDWTELEVGQKKAPFP